MYRIQVLICSRNREKLLTELLNKLQILYGHSNTFSVSVLLIDTSDVYYSIDLLARNFDNLIVFQSPTLGVAAARNLALQHRDRTSDFFAIIDDDEVPLLGWLENLVDTANSSEEIVCVGGPVMPKFIEIQSWLKDTNFYSHGSDNQNSDRQPHLACGNMLIKNFRNGIPISVPSFDDFFNESGGEDTQFSNDLKSLYGKNCLSWASSAVVLENVSAERLSVGWILRRSFNKGLVLIRLRQRNRKSTSSRFLSIGKYILLSFVPSNTSFSSQSISIRIRIYIIFLTSASNFCLAIGQIAGLLRFKSRYYGR